jgi:hypothetical protein
MKSESELPTTVKSGGLYVTILQEKTKNERDV